MIQTLLGLEFAVSRSFKRQANKAKRHLVVKYAYRRPLIHVRALINGFHMHVCHTSLVGAIVGLEVGTE